ncbi:MarC family protein [Amycolatopsis sp.]|uniref:MarC family protein n=1 Tax=Amycolatopsis sp. TaxID=37632 RepID=UPI002C05B56D|nr:MarC family protein [Amycolatopsis sp.]HVV10718.1 MarC family protein [Amycolatopsis sp.]
MSGLFDAGVFLEATITLVVIMDPPGTVPVFLSLVGRKSPAARAQAARQAVLVSLLVISLFAVAGQAILTYLGIGIPALQGAGGLLLLLIALDLLTGRGTQPEAVEDVNVALVPLGTPLLAGPGAIAATIVFVKQASGHLGAYVALALAIVAVHLVIYVCMRYSGLVIRLIRESGILLLAKIAGLLLAAIAVQLIANSVRGFIAGG